MDADAWLQKALDELVELEPVAEGDPADAWRAVALIARLLGSPSGPPPPMALVQRLPVLLVVAGAADPQELLDRIADELDSETDPAGPLFDALLDTDDALAVLALSEQKEMSFELARRAAALVSLYPERVITLGSFAEMRLQTLREGAAVGLLWSAVERAPAHVLVEALPAPASSALRVERLPKIRAPHANPAVRSFRIPKDLQLASAASETAEVRELETTEKGLPAWIYAHERRMHLEIPGVGAGPLTVVLVAECVKDGAEVARVAIDVEISGSTAYADLGPWAGPENVLHRLVASTGLASNDVRFLLEVSSG
jgi:hypothetical protein